MKFQMGCGCCRLKDCLPVMLGTFDTAYGDPALGIRRPLDNVLRYGTGLRYFREMSKEDLLRTDLGWKENPQKLDVLWTGTHRSVAVNTAEAYPPAGLSFPPANAILDYLDSGGTVVVYIGPDAMGIDGGTGSGNIRNAHGDILVNSYNTFLSSIGSNTTVVPLVDFPAWAFFANEYRNIEVFNPDLMGAYMAPGHTLGEDPEPSRQYWDPIHGTWAGPSKRLQQVFLATPNESSWLAALNVGKVGFPADYFPEDSEWEPYLAWWSDGTSYLPYVKDRFGGTFTDLYSESRSKVATMTAEKVGKGQIITIAGAFHSNSLVMATVLDIHRRPHCRTLSYANDHIIQWEVNDDVGEYLTPYSWRPADIFAADWTHNTPYLSNYNKHMEIRWDGDVPVNTEVEISIGGSFSRRPYVAIETGSESDTEYLITAVGGFLTTYSGQRDLFTYNGFTDILNTIGAPNTPNSREVATTWLYGSAPGIPQLYHTNTFSRSPVYADGYETTDILLRQNSNFYSRYPLAPPMTRWLSARIYVTRLDTTQVPAEEYQHERFIPLVPCIWQNGKYFADLEAEERGTTVATRNQSFGTGKYMTYVAASIVRMKNITNWPEVIDEQPDLAPTVDQPMFMAGWCGTVKNLKPDINAFNDHRYLCRFNDVYGVHPYPDLIHSGRRDLQTAWDSVMQYPTLVHS